MINRAFFLILLFAGLGVSEVALAQQDFTNLQNRLSRLEREITDLQRTVFTTSDGTLKTGTPPATAPRTAPVAAASGGVSPAALAAVEAKVQRLEADLRTVTGKMEELMFSIQGVSSRLDTLHSDNELRFQALEDRIAAGGGAPAVPVTQSGDIPAKQSVITPSVAVAAPSDPAPAPTPTVQPPLVASNGTTQPAAPAQAGVLGQLTGSDIKTLESNGTPTPTTQQPGQLAPLVIPGAPQPQAQVAAAPRYLPVGTPEQQYRAAFDMLVKHEYDKAELAFREFLELNEGDALSGNATYWIAETFYVRGQFEDAAIAFYESYETYPESPKVSDNLLKLGMSLSRLDRKPEACATFAKLVQEFPNPPTNVRRRLQQEVKTANCGG